MSRPYSDATLDAIAAGTLVCRACGGRYLEESPHNHETPPRPDWTPMGLLPDTLECGRPVHGQLQRSDRHGQLHWTSCCLVSEARAAWASSLPVRIHVRYVPSDVEPVAVSEYSLAAAGYVVTDREEDLLDAGIGVPFHPEFVAFVTSPTELMPRKFEAYRRHCESAHADYADHRGRTVCYALMRAVASGSTIANAATRSELSTERAAAHLKLALERVYSWRSKEINDLSGRRVRPEAA